MTTPKEKMPSEKAKDGMIYVTDPVTGEKVPFPKSEVTILPPKTAEGAPGLNSPLPGKDGLYDVEIGWKGK